MAVRLINPPGLPASPVYSQVAIASGSRTIYVSGQVARTGEGVPVGGGDLAAQVEQAYLNLATALGAAGATFADLVKVTVYVVDWRPEKMAEIGSGAERVAARLGTFPAPATTLVGVAALAEPDLLVEVEAVAVLD